jgi:hypothetical protein
VYSPPPTEPATQEMIEDGPVGLGKSIFDVPGAKHKSPATAPAAADTPAAPMPPDAAPADAAPAAPAADADDDDQDPDWLAVLAAHGGPDQGNAIIKGQDYREENHGKHTAELAEFDEYALEKLWWQRILELCNRRDDLDKQMTDKRTDITNQPPGAFHNQLLAELADLQKQRDAADKIVAIDFGYPLPIPPDVDDRRITGPFDAKRDPIKFAAWKKSTLTWIREHNGKPPWTDE